MNFRAFKEPLDIWSMAIPAEAQTALIGDRVVRLVRQPMPLGRGAKLWALCPDCGLRCRHFYAGTCRRCARIWYWNPAKSASYLTRINP